MEEKKSNGISASAFFLIIAIIVIVAMGYFIYKFYNDKITETQRANNFQAEVDRLNGTVSELQGKINSISDTINTFNEKNIETNENVTISQENEKVNIKIGTYNVDEDKYVDGPPSGGVINIESITLTDNNLCSIYEGYGTSYLGSYSIDSNNLICNTLIRRHEEGGLGYDELNIIFEFEIINNQKLKLTKIINNSRLGVIEGLEGSIYSYSANSNIKVILDD